MVIAILAIVLVVSAVPLAKFVLREQGYYFDDECGIAYGLKITSAVCTSRGVLFKVTNSEPLPYAKACHTDILMLVGGPNNTERSQFVPGKYRTVVKGIDWEQAITKRVLSGNASESTLITLAPGSPAALGPEENGSIIDAFCNSTNNAGSICDYVIIQGGRPSSVKVQC